MHVRAAGCFISVLTLQCTAPWGSHSCSVTCLASLDCDYCTASTGSMPASGDPGCVALDQHTTAVCRGVGPDTEPAWLDLFASGGLLDRVLVHLAIPSADWPLIRQLPADASAIARAIVAHRNTIDPALRQLPEPSAARVAMTDRRGLTAAEKLQQQKEGKVEQDVSQASTGSSGPTAVQAPKCTTMMEGDSFRCAVQPDLECCAMLVLSTGYSRGRLRVQVPPATCCSSANDHSAAHQHLPKGLWHSEQVSS